MGSCPLLTPPAGRWILDSRINKAILKCAAIAAKNKPKSRLKRTNMPSAQDRKPSAQDNPPSARQKPPAFFLKQLQPSPNCGIIME